MEEVVRELIAQGAETRTLDYKGPVSWKGSKADRAELIRDLMCLANTPSGGFILIGISQGSGGWVPEGVTAEQAATFDPTAIGDMAGNFCSVKPAFRVHPVPIEDKLYVLIAVE